MPVNTTVQLRRGSGENWNSVDPILSNGELGLNTDNKLFKIGDGLTTWSSLSYYPGIPLSSGTGIGLSYSKDSNNIITGISIFNAIRAGSNISLTLSNNDIVIAGSSPTTVSQGTGIVVVQAGDDYEINLDNEHVRDLIGGIVVGNSGIGVSVNDGADTITFSVTGIFSTQINDFNTAVDARVTAGSISDETIRDIVATGLNGGTGIYIEYDDDGTQLINVNVTGVSFSGHTHDDRYYTETELNTSGAGGQVDWGNLLNIPTGFTPITHTHEWSQITDASSKATLNELAYLSGVVAGTASSDRAVVLDSNKDITGIGSITTTGNVIVGGNLTVQGTTTTVNSTTVDIGDNIIRVNVSGSETQGGLEVYDHDNTISNSIVWDIVDDRWEFTGGNVYTTGNFISNNIQVGSSDLVTNLNADLLDGQHGSYYTDFGNLSGVPSPVITGILTGNVSGTASVTLTELGNGTLTINTTLADNAVTSAKIADGTIVNSDINDTAAIAVTKLASSGVTLGSTVVNLGQTSTVIDGLTRISGVSSVSPVYIYYAVIDGGSP